MKLKPNQVACLNWEALEATLETLGGADPYHWLFRGQEQASWGLQPTIERACVSGNLLRTELELFNGFRSKAHLYTSQVPPGHDDVGWLSTMQHHGIPTRLLDWSYSAYVALFFAVEKRGLEDFSALWALRIDAIESTSRKLLGTLFGLPLEAQIESHFRKIAFPPAFVSDAEGLVVPLLPKFHVSRLSSQQGCFLLKCNYRTTFEESLATMMPVEEDPWLFRISFPSTLRIEFLKRLMHFNIHPASLYPDLDGLAKFLTLKSELFPSKR